MRAWGGIQVSHSCAHSHPHVLLSCLGWKPGRQWQRHRNEHHHCSGISAFPSTVLKDPAVCRHNMEDLISLIVAYSLLRPALGCFCLRAMEVGCRCVLQGSIEPTLESTKSKCRNSNSTRLTSLPRNNSDIVLFHRLRQQGQRWRFSPEVGCRSFRCPDSAYLPTLPLETDLPSFLCTSKLILVHCSCVQGDLFLVVSLLWTPEYAAVLERLGLEDRFQNCLSPWRQHVEYHGLDGDEEDIRQFVDEADVSTGSDLWGLFYSDSPSKQGKTDDIRFVHIKRTSF